MAAGGAESGADRRWWRRPGAVRVASIVVLAVIAIEGVAVVMHLQRDEPAPKNAAVPTTAVPDQIDGFCEGVTHHYGIHGTDCKSLPIVTAPGALGPANTRGPAGGTDWEPAYPGSNVWIPDFQISGRLFVLPPGSRIPAPKGYERLGQTPDGAVLYWRPSDHPDSQPAGGGT